MKYCVIGIGHFGYEVAVTLTENGVDVLAVDKDELKIEKIRDKVAQAVCINILDEDSLRAINIEEMDGVIIGFGKNFADTVSITRILKKEFEHPMVINRTNDDIREEILELIGADEVVMPEHDAAVRLADNLSSPFPNTVRINDDLSIIEIEAPKKFISKSLEEILVYENYKVHCIGIERESETISASLEEIIQEGDTLFLAGNTNDLKSFDKF